MRIHLIPAGDPHARKNYNNTVINKIPKEKILSFENSEFTKNLKNDSYVIWGVTNGKRNINYNKWLGMNAGDICLMYRDKTFFIAGKIITKFKNYELALDLWKLKEEGITWENIFLIDETKSINISLQKYIEVMNPLKGHTKNFILQNYTTYDDEISHIIFEEFDLLNWNTPFFTIGTENLEDKRKRIESYMLKIKNTDSINKSSKRRNEQPLLREWILNKNETTCAICHKKIPNELIRAGHIIKRSQINNEDIRKQLDIVMPLCILGCDALYENEFLIVDKEGIIKINTDREISEAFKNYLKEYEGKKCLSFNENTKNFFEKKN